MSNVTNTGNRARQLFRGQTLRIWYAKLGSKSWRAYVINTGTKILLCTGPIADSPDDALAGLKQKLETVLRKTSP